MTPQHELLNIACLRLAEEAANFKEAAPRAVVRKKHTIKSLTTLVFP